MHGMSRSPISEVALGFFVTLGLVIGPPIALLAMPAGGMFLLLVPVYWIVLAIGLLKTFATSDSAMTGMGGMLAVAAVGLGFVSYSARITSTTASCKKDYTELQHPSLTRPEKIIFDDAGELKYTYEPKAMLAVLTGVEIVEVTRDVKGRTQSAWATNADDGHPCGEPLGRKTMSTPSRNNSKIDICVTTTPIANFAYDGSDAIVFRGNYGAESKGYNGCRTINVIERSGGRETQLGRFKYDTGEYTLHPSLPDSNNRLYWLFQIVKATMGDDAISDDAIRGHLIR